MLNEIWKPDTHFYNGQGTHIHAMTMPNKLIRIRNDGTVLYSIRSYDIHSSTPSGHVTFIHLLHQVIWHRFIYSIRSPDIHSSTPSSHLTFIHLLHQVTWHSFIYSIKSPDIHSSTLSGHVTFIHLLHQVTWHSFICSIRWHAIHFSILASDVTFHYTVSHPVGNSVNSDFSLTFNSEFCNCCPWEFLTWFYQKITILKKISQRRDRLLSSNWICKQANLWIISL